MWQQWTWWQMSSNVGEDWDGVPSFEEWLSVQPTSYNDSKNESIKKEGD